MSSFDLYGKIIDKKNKPKKGLTVFAYDSDNSFEGDDFLGKSKTDASGYFAINFTNQQFRKFWEFLEGSPDIYLVVKNNKDEVLMQTEVRKTKKEIVYRLKLDSSDPDPSSPDIYGDNFAKLIGTLNEVGFGAGQENSINLSLLQNPNLAAEIQKRLQDNVNGFDRTMENFNHLVAILNGVLYANIEDLGINVIDYDAPYVKRNSWKEGDTQAIMWPREESWG